jgi:hypothetical protein
VRRRSLEGDVEGVMEAAAKLAAGQHEHAAAVAAIGSCCDCGGRRSRSRSLLPDGSLAPPDSGLTTTRDTSRRAKSPPLRESPRRAIVSSRRGSCSCDWSPEPNSCAAEIRSRHGSPTGSSIGGLSALATATQIVERLSAAHDTDASCSQHPPVVQTPRREAESTASRRRSAARCLHRV